MPELELELHLVNSNVSVRVIEKGPRQRNPLYAAPYRAFGKKLSKRDNAFSGCS